MTPEEKAKKGKFEVFENERSVELSKDGETWATLEDGEIHIHNPVIFNQDVQALGSQIELWQTVLSTGDNLIQLNDKTEYEPPYAGIEVGRGTNRDPAYLLWTKESERWETVLSGNRKKLATLQDDISSFNGQLSADRVEETSNKKFFTRKRSGNSVHAGKGIEVERDESGATIHPTERTATHNFWVSNEVVKTKGTDREILPAFISCANQETKSVSSIRCRVSTGQAEISLVKNGQVVAGSFRADQEGKKHDVGLELEDGDRISIEVDRVTEARNLSVSITILTKF